MIKFNPNLIIDPRSLKLKFTRDVELEVSPLPEKSCLSDRRVWKAQITNSKVMPRLCEPYNICCENGIMRTIVLNFPVLNFTGYLQWYVFIADNPVTVRTFRNKHKLIDWTLSNRQFLLDI